MPMQQTTVALLVCHDFYCEYFAALTFIFFTGRHCEGQIIGQYQTRPKNWPETDDNGYVSRAIPCIFLCLHLILSHHHCHSGALVKRDNPRFDWGSWAIGKPNSSGVVLLGWPLEKPPTALSNVPNLDEMNTILNAINQRSCRLDLVKSVTKDGPQRSTSDGQGDGMHLPHIISTQLT
jgi:hypothetical protein